MFAEGEIIIPLDVKSLQLVIEVTSIESGHLSIKKP